MYGCVVVLVCVCCVVCVSGLCMVYACFRCAFVRVLCVFVLVLCVYSVFMF